VLGSKELKHGHERYNLDRRNLVTMKVKRVFKLYGKTYKWFSACPS
jgi:hypothetical protein